MVSRACQPFNHRFRALARIIASSEDAFTGDTMKETKQASGSPILASDGARAVVHEMMAAFEAFKGANDVRLDEIEKKAAADVLLEEKVARIDQAVAAAQARLDRVMSQNRRPVIGGEPVEPASAPEAKAAWDGYLKTGQSGALEVKAGLSGGATSGGYVVPYLIVDRAGVRVLRDPYSAKPYVLFYTTKRVGGGVQNFDAIKVMKFSAS